MILSENNSSSRVTNRDDYHLVVLSRKYSNRFWIGFGMIIFHVYFKLSIPQLQCILIGSRSN